MLLSCKLLYRGRHCKIFRSQAACCKASADRYRPLTPLVFELLKELTSIDCGTKNVEGNAQVVEIMDRLLSRIEGIQIDHRFFEGYGMNIAARVTAGNPNGTIILNGHMDTVFRKGDAARHPFHIAGDRAFGLGAADCKGGLLIAVLSVLTMQKIGMLPDKEIFLFRDKG